MLLAAKRLWCSWLTHCARPSWSAMGEAGSRRSLQSWHGSRSFWTWLRPPDRTLKVARGGRGHRQSARGPTENGDAPGKGWCWPTPNFRLMFGRPSMLQSTQSDPGSPCTSVIRADKSKRTRPSSVGRARRGPKARPVGARRPSSLSASRSTNNSALVLWSSPFFRAIRSPTSNGGSPRPRTRLRQSSSGSEPTSSSASSAPSSQLSSKYSMFPPQGGLPLRRAALHAINRHIKGPS